MSALLMFLLPNLLDWMVKGLDRALAALIRNAVVGFGGSLSVAQWNVAIGVANRLGWVMGFVNMALCALGAVAGAVRARPAESLKSFAMAFLAWPVTAAVISMVIPLQGVVGQLTARVMDSAAGEGADAASGSYIMSFVSLMFAPLGGIAWLLRVVLYLVLVIGAVGLALSMSMCSLSMILLVGVAPVPLMTLGWSASRRVMTKWVQAFLGVLLAPLCTALIIYVGGALMNSSASGLEGLWNTLVGLAAILMGIYSPRLLMPAVSFIGDNVTARLQDGAAAAERGAVTGAVRAAADVTREVVRIAAAGILGGPAGAAAQAAGDAGLGDKAGGLLGGLFKGPSDGTSRPSGEDAGKDAGPSGAEPGTDPVGGGSPVVGDGGVPAVPSPDLPPAPDAAPVPVGTRPDGTESRPDGSVMEGRASDPAAGARIQAVPGPGGLPGEAGLPGAAGSGGQGGAGEPGEEGHPGRDGLPGPHGREGAAAPVSARGPVVG